MLNNSYELICEKLDYYLFFLVFLTESNLKYVFFYKSQIHNKYAL